MADSDSDTRNYTPFIRPYPVITAYEAELQPFYAVGCEVRFSRPRGGHVMVLRGYHRELDLAFEVQIPNECREEPSQMRVWLQEVWEQFKQMLDSKQALRAS